MTIEQIGEHLSGTVTTPPSMTVYNYYLKYLPVNNDFNEQIVVVSELDYVVALAGDQGTVGLGTFLGQHNRPSALVSY